jgi:hypothetical protein
MIQLIKGNASISSSENVARPTWSHCTSCLGGAHVTRASASIPKDFYGNSTDDDVQELEKSPLNANMAMLQNQNNKKRKTSSSTGMEDKEEKSSPFLQLYKKTSSGQD